MFLANENAISAGGYNIANSLRFQSASSQYLSRTPASATNQTTWTWSGWVKLGAISTAAGLFSQGSSIFTQTRCFITSNGQLLIDSYISNVTQFQLITTQVFRDPSAWYHIVMSVDTTQATSTNRIKVYVNGSQVTAFGTATYPAQNYNTQINTNSIFYIGAGDRSPTYYLDGYLAEVNFIDGQALTPSSFGETNTLTGQWVAKKYAGTYGTNGFYLPFSNGTSTTTLGYDSSGNGNNWTLTNFTRSAGVSDCWMYDVPSGNGSPSATQPSSNYCVLNPLGGFLTPSRANLQISQGAAWNSTGSTIYPTTGKWYVEASPSILSGAQYIGVGLRPAGQIGSGEYAGSVSGSYGGILSSLNINTYSGGVAGSSLSGTFTTSTPICMAVDFDAGKVWFGSNNSWVGGGNPATGTSPTYTFTANTQFNIYFSAYANDCYPNFGQRAFAYTPPSGYNALCTANLPASTIVKGNQYMDATTYTGNLIGQSITNAAGFKPDLVWVKSRSAATDNKLTDSVRGAQTALISNSTAAETTDLTGVVSFNSGGFTLGTSTTYNNTGATYVGWQWQAGQGTTSSNTSGSITSTVSVSTTAGFSVVTYTGTGANATVGHGLGVAPKMVIVRGRSAAKSWVVWHTAFAGTDYLLLEGTNAKQTLATVWNSTIPTSTVFSIGTDTTPNQSTITYVAYCFAEIAGFSKFGSYTGNGSADGPFVYLGFRPKFVMIKRTDVANDWVMYDTSRSTYNVDTILLTANTANNEAFYASGYDLDILSNGFKARTGPSGAINTNAGTYIYMAFAENPLAQSNAR